jgi:putative membrane protein
MLKVLLRVAVIAVAILAITRFVPKISVDDWQTAVIVAVVWAIISVTIKPILGLLTLPITILSFGLFSVLINAILFWLVAAFVPGFSVGGLLPALLGSVILSIVIWISHRLF